MASNEKYNARKYECKNAEFYGKICSVTFDGEELILKTPDGEEHVWFEARIGTATRILWEKIQDALIESNSKPFSVQFD